MTIYLNGRVSYVLPVLTSAPVTTRLRFLENEQPYASEDGHPGAEGSNKSDGSIISWLWRHALCVYIARTAGSYTDIQLQNINYFKKKRKI